MRPIVALGMAWLFVNITAGADKDLIPAQLSQPQRDALLRFLDKHRKPDRFVPRDARLVGPTAQPVEVPNVEPPPGKTLKQYTVQILPHRPVPGQEVVRRADVYYYRPNPVSGRQGITIKHTVDLATGDQVGATEVLVKHHTPVSKEELDEAVLLAKEKSPAIQAFYTGRNPNDVRWEYLQMKINKPHEQHEPGDRAVRLVFTATPPDGQDAPTPVRVVVNLTKNLVTADLR